MFIIARTIPSTMLPITEQPRGTAIVRMPSRISSFEPSSVNGDPALSSFLNLSIFCKHRFAGTDNQHAGKHRADAFYVDTEIFRNYSVNCNSAYFEDVICAETKARKALLKNRNKMVFMYKKHPASPSSGSRRIFAHVEYILTFFFT